MMRHELPKAKSILSESLELRHNRILISCHEGKSRSSLLALCYLVEKMNSYEDAFWKLKAIRPIMSIHKGFNPILDKLRSQYPNTSNQWL